MIFDKKRSVALAACLLLMPIPLVQAHDCHRAAVPPAQDAPLEGMSVYHLHEIWTAQDGHRVQLGSLRGNPVVAAMIYTSCKTACPMITAYMQGIQRGLAPELQRRIRFVLFSMDSRRDTPDQLLRFAKAHGLDLRQWTLLQGSPSSVRELAAALGVRYRQDAAGDFTHSNAITLLDSEGVIRGQATALTEDPNGLSEKVKSLR